MGAIMHLGERYSGGMVVDSALSESSNNPVRNSVVTKALSNPNLLDNPWFTVNQRGLSTYPASSVYTVDRWRTGSSRHETDVLNGSIKWRRTAADANPEFKQILEQKLPAGTYTLSTIYKPYRVNTAKVSMWEGSSFDFQLYDTTNSTVLFNMERLPYNNGEWSFAKLTFALESDYNVDVRFRDYAGVDAIGSIGDYLQIKAVKLEKGSVSTLTMDAPPNYATELLKCQRYFYRKNCSGGSPFAFGFSNSSGNARVSIVLPVPMRTSPTLTATNPTHFLVLQDGQHAVTAVALQNYLDNIATLNMTSSGLGSNATLTVRNDTDTDHLPILDFSADI